MSSGVHAQKVLTHLFKICHLTNTLVRPTVAPGMVITPLTTLPMVMKTPMRTPTGPTKATEVIGRVERSMTIGPGAAGIGPAMQTEPHTMAMVAEVTGTVAWTDRVMRKRMSGTGAGAEGTGMRMAPGRSGTMRGKNIAVPGGRGATGTLARIMIGDSRSDLAPSASAHMML